MNTPCSFFLETRTQTAPVLMIPWWNHLPSFVRSIHIKDRWVGRKYQFSRHGSGWQQSSYFRKRSLSAFDKLRPRFLMMGRDVCHHTNLSLYIQSSTCIVVLPPFWLPLFSLHCTPSYGFDRFQWSASTLAGQRVLGASGSNQPNLPQMGLHRHLFNLKFIYLS